MVPTLSVLLLLLAWPGGHAAQTEEALIGWQGEKSQQPAQAEGNSRTPSLDAQPFIETISWQPRAFLYHNFLTHAECDHLIEKAERRVMPSLVVDSKTGGSKSDSIRTSYGAAFQRGEDPIIAGIEARIAEWTHIPPDYGEALQVLRYMNGQKYDAHWDWFDDSRHKPSPGMDNRYATVLIYLSEVEAGGETALPLASAIDERVQSLANASHCASRMGIAVRPRKGSALLFFDMDIAGSKGDRRALHASCPTLAGTKYTCTKWLHNHPMGRGYNPLYKAGECTDMEPDCKQKIEKGGCMQNGMVGLGGKCRLSCGDCKVCPHGDILCYRSNLKSKADTIQGDVVTQT